MSRRGCSVASCSGTHYGHGYCRRHWARWRRHGAPLGVVRSRRSCSVAGCERAHHGRGYCRSHWARWRRHGDARAAVPVNAPGGAESYASVRYRLRQSFGPATARCCATCDERAAVWAYDGTDTAALVDVRHGPYSLDLDRYRSLCRSCHRRAAGVGGAVALDVDRAVWLYQAGASSRGIAALLDVSPNTILRALRSRNVPIRPRGRTR